ncbi:alpha/beta hydrolase [Geofilum sp. OHC36d9]|uniref:alpha/beta hydrolase n=1 Tax=Geofilum sp. OHC36d9 TaxID=3458413 RepID=UPI00403459C0
MKPVSRMLSVIFYCLSITISAQQVSKNEKTVYTTELNVPYYSKATSDDYVKKQCVLDIYYPSNIQNFATVIWFHSGGLTSGHKEIPTALKGKGFCVIGVGYRLSPNVSSPTYIEDAAAAEAWVFQNIEKYGGNPKLIFISGHSAGGYLTLMTGLDKKWLKTYNIDANQIAGLIPFSPQCITHFTVRKERGIADKQPIVDDMAPLFHVRPDAPPLLLITGDRELEMLGRYEENAYLARMMKVVGHTQTRLYEMDGYNHGNMPKAGFPLLIQEIERVTKGKNASKTRP